MNSLWSTFYGRWFMVWHTPCRFSDSLLVHRTNLLRLKQNIKTVHWSVAVLAVAFVAASVAISVWLLIFGGAEYLYSQLVSVYELSASGVTSNKWLAIYTLLCFVVQLLILPAGSLILVAAGFIFSPVLAVAIFSTVQILCSWPVYKAGQHIFQNAPDRFQKLVARLKVPVNWQNAVEDEGFFITIVLRLTPIIPSAGACLLAAGMNIRLRHFIFATVVICWVRPLFFASIGGSLQSLVQLPEAASGTSALQSLLLVFFAACVLLVCKLLLRRRSISS